MNKEPTLLIKDIVLEEGQHWAVLSNGTSYICSCDTQNCIKTTKGGDND